MNAATKSVLAVTLYWSRQPSTGCSPAPTIPTTEATMIHTTLTTLNQLNRSSVLGIANNNVGMAKIPVYNIKQSLFELRTPKAIWPASSCPPVAKTAKTMVPNERISRPTGPARIYPASPILWTVTRRRHYIRKHFTAKRGPNCKYSRSRNRGRQVIPHLQGASA